MSVIFQPPRILNSDEPEKICFFGLKIIGGQWKMERGYDW